MDERLHQVVALIEDGQGGAAVATGAFIHPKNGCSSYVRH
jgi:hypothetical protein